MPTDISSMETGDLVAKMLDGERLKDLWLASTAEVAETIVRSWPEFLALQIRGGLSIQLFEASRQNVSTDGLFVLSVLAKSSSEPDLKALGARNLIDQSDQATD